MDIENIQLEAARIITGAIKGTPHNKIYNETKWTTTNDRRDRRNMITFYKLYHNLTPDYMKNMLPKKIRNLHTYNLRNKNDISKQPVKSTLRMNSFVSHMVDKWNSLDDDIKLTAGLKEFTRHLKKNDKKPPKYYSVGDRKSNIHHARMRMKCSLLSDDLYKMHIIEDPKCACGYANEDATHYLFQCTQ